MAKETVATLTDRKGFTRSMRIPFPPPIQIIIPEQSDLSVISYVCGSPQMKYPNFVWHIFWRGLCEDQEDICFAEYRER
jgi:hypothetical protein